MEELIPLILMGLGWLFIGLPVTLAQKKKRALEQAAAQRKTAAAAARPAAPALVPVTPVSDGIPARESRLAPSISVTRNDDSIYQGSLNAVTGEGYDPCHEGMLVSPAAAESVPAPVGDTARLPFGWTGSDIVRGVVISEVLNRKKAM